MRETLKDRSGLSDSGAEEASGAVDKNFAQTVPSMGQVLSY